MEPISIDDFKKVEIRVGQIMSAEPIEGSEKLLKLKVNFGSEERQVLSGLRHTTQSRLHWWVSALPLLPIWLLA